MIKVFRKILDLLDRKEKRVLPFIFAMMVFETILETVGISVVVPLVTAVMDENVITSSSLIKSICEFFCINSHKSFIVFCIIVLLAVYVLKCFFMLYECGVRYDFICRSRHYVQKKIFASILDRPYEYFLNIQSSEIIREVADDCNRTFDLFSFLLDVFANIILTLGICTILLVINARMTVVVVLMMAALAFILVVAVKPILRKSGEELIEYATKNYTNLLEAVQGIKIVKITKSADYFKNEFRKNGEKVIDAQRKNTIINRIPIALSEFMCVSAVLIYLLVLVQNGVEVSGLIPTAGAFVLASLRLVPSTKKIINVYSEITFCKVAVDNVCNNYNSIVTTVKDKADEEISLKKSIRLENITFRYPDSDRKILDNASLTIPAHKSVGVIGLSGIGKTTTADVLLGLLKPESGDIYFDDVKADINIDTYPIRIGYVPQSIYIRNDTIRNNIVFGVPEDKINNDLLNETIRMARLEDFINELPDGLDTNIGENGVRISGGQRQRIGIARALYNKPDLLVFDEATSSLDLETEACILQSIESLQGKKTMLIIAHRLQVIENCDYVYRMKNGKFINEKKENN